MISGLILMLQKTLNRILRFNYVYFLNVSMIPFIIIFITYFMKLQFYPRKFIKPEITKSLNCDSFFDRNETQRKIVTSKYAQKRITWKTPDNFPMKCADIYSRHYFPKKPLSAAEAMFPIAFVKNVYTDYFIMEQELATTYAPQNFYCFSIDSKSTEIFRTQIRSLSSCFSNVFVAEKEFPIDSSGHFNTYAQFECLKILIKFNWKYAILLLSHDVAIKTNAEIVQILTWLDGTNDVMMVPVNPERINRNYNWTFEELKIFKNESHKNLNGTEESQTLRFVKGMTEAALSKEMIYYIFTELDLTKTLLQFNDKNYFANDENIYSTLLATEALNIPGGYFHRCVDEVGGHQFFTRKSNWSTVNATCFSRIWRKFLCIYGVEDLIALEKSPEMFANKMLPEKDFGAYICWNEKMFQRIYGPEIKPPSETLNSNIYLNHPAVRFNRLKKLPNFDSKRFQCI